MATPTTQPDTIPARQDNIRPSISTRSNIESPSKLPDLGENALPSNLLTPPSTIRAGGRDLQAARRIQELEQQLDAAASINLADFATTAASARPTIQQAIGELTVRLQQAHKQLATLQNSTNRLLAGAPKDNDPRTKIVVAVVNAIDDANSVLQPLLDGIPLDASLAEGGDPESPTGNLGDFLGLQTLISNFGRVFRYVNARAKDVDQDPFRPRSRRAGEHIDATLSAPPSSPTRSSRIQKVVSCLGDFSQQPKAGESEDSIPRREKAQPHGNQAQLNTPLRHVNEDDYNIQIKDLQTQLQLSQQRNQSSNREIARLQGLLDARTRGQVATFDESLYEAGDEPLTPCESRRVIEEIKSTLESSNHLRRLVSRQETGLVAPRNDHLPSVDKPTSLLEKNIATLRASEAENLQTISDLTARIKDGDVVDDCAQVRSELAHVKRSLRGALELPRYDIGDVLDRIARLRDNGESSRQNIRNTARDEEATRQARRGESPVPEERFIPAERNSAAYLEGLNQDQIERARSPPQTLDGAEARRLALELQDAQDELATLRAAVERARRERDALRAASAANNINNNGDNGQNQGEAEPNDVLDNNRVAPQGQAAGNDQQESVEDDAEFDTDDPMDLREIVRRLRQTMNRNKKHCQEETQSLNSQIRDLQGTILKLNNRIFKLNEQIQKAKERCDDEKKELRDRIRRLNEQWETFNSTLDGGGAAGAGENNNNNDNGNPGSSQGDTQGNRINDAAQRGRDAHSRAREEDLRLKNQNLHRRIQKLDEDIQDVDSTNVEQEEQIHQLEEEINHQKAQIGTLKDHNLDLEEAEIESRNEIEAQEKEIQRLKDELQSTRDEQRLERSEAAGCLQEISDIKGSIRLLRENRDRLLKQESDSDDGPGSLEAQLAYLRRRKSKYKARVKRLRKERNDLWKQLNDKQYDSADDLEDVDFKRLVKGRRRGEGEDSDESNEENSDQAEEYDVDENGNEDSGEGDEGDEGDDHHHKGKQAADTDSLASFASSVTSSSSSSSDYDPGSQNRLCRRISQRADEVEALRDNIHDREEEIEDLRAHLQDQLTRAQIAEDVIEEREIDIDNLQDELATAQDAIVDEQARVGRRDATIAQLRAALHAGPDPVQELPAAGPRARRRPAKRAAPRPAGAAAPKKRKTEAERLEADHQDFLYHRRRDGGTGWSMRVPIKGPPR